MRCSVFFLLIVLSSMVAAEPVATVVRVSGTAISLSNDGEAERLQRGGQLNEGVRIQTGADAQLTLKFNDNTLLRLDELTDVTLTAYQPRSEAESRFLLDLLTGRLRVMTGALAADPDAFELRTPHASIGVRGTEFEVRLSSPTETRIRQISGEVLVSSLEFQGQVLRLTDTAPFAAVSLNNPAQPRSIDPTPAMPPFAPSLLVPGIPAIIPLSAKVPESSQLPEPMDTLVTLVEEQQWLAARSVADELQDRFEGLPRFDLYNGLVLMHEGHFDEAIFAFERVLIFEPNQHRARLELGRAYYLTRNFSRAREALEQVLVADPPAVVRQRVRSLLNRIDQAEQRQRVQTHVGGTLLMGWDSNANNGSQLDEPLDDNLLDLTELAEISQAESSAYLQWTFATGAFEPTSQRSGRQFSVEFSNKNYLNDAVPDSSALSLSGQVLHQTDRWRTRLPATVQWSWLDGRSWTARLNLSAAEQFNAWGPLWVGVKVGTDVSLGVNDAVDTTVKDLAGLVFDAEERGRVHTFSTTYLRHRQAGLNNGHVEWSGLSNEYRLTWSLPWQIQGAFKAEHQWRRYQADDLLFTEGNDSTALKRRRDQAVFIDAQLSWPAADWLLLLSNLGWETLDSNINAYGRNRLIASQAIRIRF